MKENISVSVEVAFKIYAIFIPFSKLCLAWVCLFLGWVTYVWHCVCLLFVGIMLGIGFVCLLVG